MEGLDAELWQKSFDEFEGLDLSIKHHPDDHRIEILEERDVNDVLVSMGKITKKGTP